MKRILFLTSSLTSGGSERVVSLLANKFVEKGYGVEIALLKYEDVFYPIDKRIRVHIAKIEAGGNNILRVMRWLRMHVRQSSPDVVIAFTEGVYCAAICAMIGINTPIISSERNDPAFMSPARKLLRRIFLRRTTWLVVQTERIKQYFNRQIQEKTSIIYNPVNERVYGVETCNCRQKRITNVARLYPQKNQNMLIDAFSELSERFPEWTLDIYGVGPLHDELQAHIDKLRMDNRIFLKGQSDKVIDELNQSRIFCLSSDFEGMSNAMIEAICLGVPIVSTQVSGTEEFLRNGENSLLIDVGEKEQLKDALETLMGDEMMQKKFSEELLKLKDNFQIDEIVMQWENLVLQVAQS